MLVPAHPIKWYIAMYLASVLMSFTCISVPGFLTRFSGGKSSFNNSLYRQKPLITKQSKTCPLWFLKATISYSCIQIFSHFWMEWWRSQCPEDQAAPAPVLPTGLHCMSPSGQPHGTELGWDCCPEGHYHSMRILVEPSQTEKWNKHIIKTLKCIRGLNICEPINPCGTGIGTCSYS